MGGDTPADEPMETQYHSEHEGLIESVVFEQYESLNRTRWRLPICSQSVDSEGMQLLNGSIHHLREAKPQTQSLQSALLESARHSLSF